MRIEPRDLYGEWQAEFLPQAIAAIVEAALCEMPQEPSDDIPMVRIAQRAALQAFKTDLAETLRSQLRQAPASLLISWGARLDGSIPDFEDYQEAA